MPDALHDALTALSGVGWPAAIVALVGLLLVIIRITHKAAKRRRRAKAARKSAYARALSEYDSAMASGNAEAICEARNKLDAMRAVGWHLLAIVAAACFVGCRSTPVRFVPVGEYIQFPRGGDVVPELPVGETRWILMSSPTGARMALPSDSPLSSVNIDAME